MGLYFKKSYVDIMNDQLQLDMLTVQLDLEYPKSDITEMLRTLHVIPEEPCADVHLIPDLFETWKELCRELATAHSEHFSSMVDTLHSAEGKSELKLWGRATGAVNVWSMHQDRYHALVEKVNSLRAEVTDRRENWKDCMARGGSTKRRQSSRLRTRRRQ